MPILEKTEKQNFAANLAFLKSRDHLTDERLREIMCYKNTETIERLLDPAAAGDAYNSPQLPFLVRLADACSISSPDDLYSLDPSDFEKRYSANTLPAPASLRPRVSAPTSPPAPPKKPGRPRKSVSTSPTPDSRIDSPLLSPPAAYPIRPLESQLMRSMEGLALTLGRPLRVTIEIEARPGIPAAVKLWRLDEIPCS